MICVRTSPVGPATNASIPQQLAKPAIWRVYTRRNRKGSRE